MRNRYLAGGDLRQSPAQIDLSQRRPSRRLLPAQSSKKVATRPVRPSKQYPSQRRDAVRTRGTRPRAPAFRSRCQRNRKRESARLWKRIQGADAPRTIWQKYESMAAMSTAGNLNVGRTSAAPDARVQKTA